MRGLFGAAFVAAFVAASVGGPPGVAAAQPGEDAGAVSLVDPTDPGRAYDHGDSSSAFALALPDGAACPGDSANDGWRIQSFIVPVGTDPGAMRFQALRPVSDDPASHRALREVSGAIFTQRMTAPNEGPGEPGRIDQGPALTFAHFDTGTFPAGHYRMGLACTPIDWHVAKYWDIEIVFEEAPDVEPGGLRWTVVADGMAPVTTDAGFELPSWATSIAVLTLVAALFAFWSTRTARRRRDNPAPAGTTPGREIP